jgi:hypothetical protein
LQVFSRPIVVDATVKDAKGQPVHGLKQSDFTVKEDGKPQSLRSFQQVREDTPPGPRNPPADDIQHIAVTPLLPLTTVAPTPYGNNMQESIGRGVPTSSQLLFDVRIAPSAEQAKPGDATVLGTLDQMLKNKPPVRYEFQYLLPSWQIAFGEGPGGTRKCSLEFDIAAYDVYGKLVTGLSQTRTPPPLTPEQYHEFIRKPQQFLQEVGLPPGEIFLRGGILDRVSDKVGTQEIPMTIKKQPAPLAGPPGGKGEN